MLPIILDTDIGTDVDDALALTLAIQSPELKVLAVTTVDGDPRLRARIARKLLDLLGREDIPVATGSDHQLNGKPFTQPVIGAQGFIETEQDGLPLQEEHAVDLIIRILQSSERKITLVTIGAVTNVATALQRCPEVKEKIERLVMMGGCITPSRVLKQEGWARWLPDFLKARMEFNLNADQEAAEVVMRSGIPFVLAPVEMTMSTYLTKQELDQIQQSRAPQAEALNRMCDHFLTWFSSIMKKMPVDQRIVNVYLHDPLAVAVLLNPRFITVKDFHLIPARRFGVFRTLPQKNHPANGQAITNLDVQAFKRLFAERVFGVRLN